MRNAIKEKNNELEKEPKRDTITVNEVLDALSTNSKWAAADIFLTPLSGNRSDADSADSDDEDDALLHHLSRNQLLASCELQVQMHDEDDIRVL